MDMENVMTLKQTLLEELKDLYSAEQQLVEALPKMIKRATTESLISAFSDHLKETENHVRRLEQIGEILGQDLKGKTCRAMEGLVKEGEEIVNQTEGKPELIDTLLIGAAQRVEHYEMAGYGTARALADILNLDEVVEILQDTLDEESEANERLTEVSEEEVLPSCLADEQSSREQPSDKAQLFKAL